MRHSLSRGTSSQVDNSSVPTEPEPAAKVTGRPQSSQEPGRKPPEMERCVKKTKLAVRRVRTDACNFVFVLFPVSTSSANVGKKEADAGCG